MLYLLKFQVKLWGGGGGSGEGGVVWEGQLKTAKQKTLSYMILEL